MNRSNRTDLIVAHQTHAGETGKNNEDRAIVLSYEGAPGDRGVTTLAIVADGIGGHRAGEVASQLAIDTITQLFNQTDSRAYLDLFARGFALTGQALTQYTATNAQWEGMGTTCAAVVIANRRLYTAYIGDSRIYLMRDGRIRQITVDHTWVQEAIEHGVLTREEARKHPNRHVVRRHLGAKSDPTPDYRLQLSDAESAEAARRNQGLPLKPGDIILLSSDGLTDLVEDQEILAAFQAQPLQAATDALTVLARQRGGFDNITVIALQVPGKPAPQKQSRSSSARLGGAAIALGIFGGLSGLIIIAAALAAGYIYVILPSLTGTPRPTDSPTAAASPPATFTPQPMQATALTATPTPITPTATPTPTPTQTFRPSPTIDLTAAPLTASAITQTGLPPQATAIP